MSTINQELCNIREKLLNLKAELKETSQEVKIREFKYSRMKGNLDNVADYQSNPIVLNVGGSIFHTTKSTLLSVKNSLLERIVSSGEFDLNKEIFIDRSPKLFPMVLNFYRTGKVNYKAFETKQDLRLFRNEADFFQLLEVLDYIDSRMKEIKFVDFKFTGPYVYHGNTAGTNRLEDLSDETGLRGICSNAPGSITIELNEEWEFKELVIGGWRANKSLWYADNGAGADISVSTNGIKWTSIGKIPSGFGSSNKEVKFTSCVARYIKFSISSYLGIGYLKIHKMESLFD